ncbi:MAG: DNA-protecting protein DprA [Ruminococcaceae bacterium]|nr:DNA-protecting protein DprA [Oscillospiraceae bacterium]
MEYYVWLQLCLKQGSRYIARIFEAFPSAKAVYESDAVTRQKLLPKSVYEKLNNSKLSEAKEICEKCNTLGITLIHYHNRNFPEMLRQIDNPPIVLYVRGTMPDFESLPSISIVGPRVVSDYGKKAAYSLGYRLARAGFIVVSGGAIGSDTYAHIGALKAEGITVLIMACGFSVSYLEENRALREHIAKSGCLISEYPPDVPVNRGTFQVRNRLLSGLSLGTVLVEAGKRSGALITANHAVSQGRDVFVIPGMPNMKQYLGSNALLRDGAKPLLDTSDIFNEYISRFPDKIDIEKAYKEAPKPEKVKNNKKILNVSLSNQAKIVYNYLDKQKFYPDDLNTGLSSSDLLSALTELEMEFIIRALPGGQYEICK